MFIFGTMKITTLNNKPRVLAKQENRPVYLIQQYYKPDYTQRAKEIDMCLRMNMACKGIHTIVLLTEKEYGVENLPVPTTAKLQVISIGRRLEYADILEYVRGSVPRDAIVLFGNADIFIRDDFVDKLRGYDMQKTFIALTRWDVDTRGGATIFSDRSGRPRPDTQDLWGILAEDIYGIREEDIDLFRFQFGKPGCDNKIAAIMNQLGFYCCNPALTLKSYHLHNSGFRMYTEADRILGEDYVYLTPTE
jgi:hypothetical protein